MRLSFNPFQIFQNSRTPAGLYARQKWLDQGRTKNWQRSYNKTVSKLLQGQIGNGSWDHSILQTIHRLFGLHLTIRERTRSIEKALNWLFEYSLAQFPRKHVHLDCDLDRYMLYNLPFSPGCSGYFLYGATLFLSTIFGLEKDDRALFMYQTLAENGLKLKGRWCGLSCTNNIFRAFIVHPVFSHHDAILLAVEALAHEQEPSGRWKKPIPFYQTVNALAHLNLKTAETQLKAVFKKLSYSQQKDGTWSNTSKEWNTFLIVHALKNKGEL
jgi:hypothetical protein